MFGLTYMGRVESAHAFAVTDPAWRDYWCHGCEAFTWGRVIVFRSPQQLQCLDVRAHEAEHVNQSRRIGLLLYPLWYWWEHHHKGYYSNRFEVAARTVAARRVHHSVSRLEGAGLVAQRAVPVQRRTKANKGEQRRTKANKERRVVQVIQFG